MVRTVLLCDTKDGVSSLQEAWLGDLDLFVDVVTDPDKAIETVARTRPDVVLTRLSMEGFTGTELLSRLRDPSPTSRLVVRMRTTEPARIAACLTAGAHGIVHVHDEPDEVRRVVLAAADGVVAFSSSIAAASGAALDAALAEVDRLDHDLTEVRASIAQGTSAKADFLSNISHELRTPVTVAKGIAYVLRNPGVGDEERIEFLDQLQGSLDALIGIVDELIAISELERGTFELDLAHVDLAPAVRRAVDAIGRRYPATEIQAVVAPVLPTVADELRIEGVIEELLENACRYSPDDAAVEITGRSMSEGIVVSVTDHGVGLHRAIAKRSFEEPFTTGEGVLRKEKAGVGVGLHLARQLVTEHGGTLWADPLPGGGTRVTFCIPPRD